MSKAKNIKLIGYVSLGLLTGIGVVAIAIPAANQSARWISEEQQLTDTNNGLLTDLTTLKGVQKDHDKVVALNKQLATKFPSAANGTLLLTDVSNAAAAAGIPASSIEAINLETPVLVEAKTSTDAKATTSSSKTSATAAPASGSKASTAAPVAPKMATMGVEITVIGNGTQLSAFLKALGQVDRAIKIDSTKISEVKAADGAGLNTMTIVGTTILYQALEDPTSAAAKSSSGTKPSTATPAPTPTSTKK